MRTPARPARFLKTPHIVTLVAAAVVLPLVISGFSWAKKGVTVVVDGEPVYHTTAAQTVAEVLEEVDLVIAEGDIVSPLPDAPVTDGTEIVVRQAVPVTLECNGATVELKVIGSTVADALVAAGLDPTTGLHVDPPVDAELAQEMTITATDVFVRIVKEDAELPFETIEQEDPGLPVGQRRTVSEGAPGSAVRIYEVLVVGEVETTRAVRYEETIVAPTPAVVRVGTKPPARHGGGSTSAGVLRPGADASLAPPSSGDTLAVTATAYTPWDPGCSGMSAIERRIAAHGIPDGWGIVAVDPRVIPLGTRMYVPGYGYAVAADTGGLIKGDKIDVCYWAGGPGVAKATSRVWGRRAVTITILE